MDNLSSEKPTARRPDLFRALGADEPPGTLSIGDESFRFAETLKHDSWAATALYISEGGRKVVCKFGRSSPLPLGVPGAWIGRWLAGREERMLRAMTGQNGIPRWAGPVRVGGREWPDVVTHEWIPGQPFEPIAKVGDDFFPRLQRIVSGLHERGVAYMDMSKWANIIVGDDGDPYLIDYQIYFRPSRGPLGRFFLRHAQAGDRYYFNRHWRRCRPDQLSAQDIGRMALEPPHIWLAERAGPFFRGIRLFLLRLCGVKGDPRRAQPRTAAAN